MEPQARPARFFDYTAVHGRNLRVPVRMVMEAAAFDGSNLNEN